MDNWKEIARKAKHYLAIGQKRVYLDGRGSDYPWSFVTRCEPGGSHRLDIYTSVRFYAEHPSGLSFDWSFEIEPHTANGSGRYHIDVEGCQKIIASIPTAAKKQFRTYLAECAAKVREKGDEYREIAEKQYSDALALEKATTPAQ